MINIISKSYYSKRISGPKKVVDNFIKGLEMLDYPYSINKSLDSCQRLWIHDDITALKKAGNLSQQIKIIAGPNLYVLPGNINPQINLSGMVYVQPSGWVKDLWQAQGFDKCPIEIWPVGVDTEQFKPVLEKKELVLVYFKQRSEEDLLIIENLLKNKSIKYEILRYGQYEEPDYQKMLSKTRYVVWLGNGESQGLALLEAMSCNVPILVCDPISNRFSFSNPQKKLYNEVTNAPYFSADCGIKIKSLEGLNGAVDQMELMLNTFKPRQYVEQNLGLRSQAEKLVKIYEKYFNLLVSEGYKEHLLKKGDWVNNSVFYRVSFYLKDIIKNLK